jgi:uncharacterized protein
MSERFEPGQPILMRHVRGSYNWCAPMRVVEDRGDFVALYLQPGSTYARMVHEGGEFTRDFTEATATAETTWGMHHALHLVRFGDEHATILFWAEDTWEFRCWYLNFQKPLRRFERGFESMDLTLDTLISPDRTAWQWKDEDEFVEYGIAGGWYTHEQLAHLKAYGERVVAQALAGEPPFADGWEHWRPPAAWQPLELPADWRE